MTVKGFVGVNVNAADVELDRMIRESVADQMMLTKFHEVGHGSRSYFLTDIVLDCGGGTLLEDGKFAGVNMDLIVRKKKKRRRAFQSLNLQGAVDMPEQQQEDNVRESLPPSSYDDYDFMKLSSSVPLSDEEHKGNEADDGEELYNPSSIWFEQPKRLEKKKKKKTLSRKREDPPTAQPLITQSASKRTKQQEQADENGRCDLPKTPRASTTPKSSTTTPISLTTPSSAVFKTPTSPFVSSGMEWLDVECIPKDIRMAALENKASLSIRPLFFPSPPSLLVQGRARDARLHSLECPTCRSQFHESAALAFHVLKFHWPKLESDPLNDISQVTLVRPPMADQPAAEQTSKPLTNSNVSSNKFVIMNNPTTPLGTSSNAVTVNRSNKANGGVLVSVAKTPVTKPAATAHTVMKTPQISRSAPTHNGSTTLVNKRNPIPLPNMQKKNSPLSLTISSPKSEFEVEAILRSRNNGGKEEFLVRWAGFSTQHQTWEIEENLHGCDELLREFRKSKEKPNKKREQEKRRKAPKQKTKGPRVLAFLDLEANLSGTGSSDELDDEELEEEFGSFLVDDDEDIIYSGTPPSQHNIDVGFYRRMNHNSEESPVPLTRPKKKKNKKKKKEKARLKKRELEVDDGDVDVEIIDTPQKSQSRKEMKRVEKRLCLVCQCETTSPNSICDHCSNLQDKIDTPPPEIVRDILVCTNREISSNVVNLLFQKFGKSTKCLTIPAYDADFIISFDTAVLRYMDRKIAKLNQAELMEHVLNAQKRNKNVTLIIENSKPPMKKGAVYEKAISCLFSVPKLCVMFSRSDDETARLISEMQARVNSVEFTKKMALIDVHAHISQIQFLTKLPNIGKFSMFSHYYVHFVH